MEKDAGTGLAAHCFPGPEKTPCGRHGAGAGYGPHARRRAEAGRGGQDGKAR